jgi:hypothetical protein
MWTGRVFCNYPQLCFAIVVSYSIHCFSKFLKGTHKYTVPYIGLNNPQPTALSYLH